MSRPHFEAFHRPIVRAGVAGPDAVPIADWSTSWQKARNELLGRGLAIYVHGLFVMASHVTIEMETRYS